MPMSEAIKKRKVMHAPGCSFKKFVIKNKFFRLGLKVAL